MALTRSSTKKNETEAQKAELAENEKLDRQTLKTGIEAAIKGQILNHVANGPILSNEGFDRGGMRDGTERPEEIGNNNWLEWQHVYGLIPSLVAEREHLRETVAVFPPFSQIRMNEFLENTAESKVIQNLGLPTRVTPNGDVVIIEEELPPIAGLTASQLEHRTQEIQKRNRESRERRTQARALLTKNSLGNDKTFLLYLQAIGESQQNFLGNSHKRNIKLNECQQVIIPFNQDNRHYTVAVTHFIQEGDKKIAHIKYYDSMGSDLAAALKQQIRDYFTLLGFEARYSCISRRDQREGHNCSIFASFKAIDIANENSGNPERLLGTLTADNYVQFMTMYRYVVSLILREFGQNVVASDGLKVFLKSQQETFAQASGYSQRLGLLNALLLDIKNQLEHSLILAKALPSTTVPVTTKLALPDFEPSVLLRQSEHLFTVVQTAYTNLQQKENKTPEDKDVMQSLYASISIYNILRADLEQQVMGLEQTSSRASLVVQVRSAASWVSSLDWSTLAIVLPLGTLSIFMGLPLLLLAGLEVGAMLSANLAVTILGGVFLFVAGAFVISYISDLLTAEDEGPGYLIQGHEIQDNQPLPPHTPMITTQFQHERQNNKASSPIGGVVDLTQAQKSPVARQ